VPTISMDNGVVTLVNVLSVDSENQQELIDLLIAGTKNVFRHQPGYISTAILRSTDGKTVANFAQYRSAEDFQAILQNPEAQQHVAKALKIAVPEFHLYEVSYTDGDS
jgi:hypothetical protein